MHLPRFSNPSLLPPLFQNNLFLPAGLLEEFNKQINDKSQYSQMVSGFFSPGTGI